MTPVFPYLIRRSQDGWRGELLLRLRSGKAAYVIHLSLEQARMLAVEMRGLASDHCPLHHMTVRVAESLNAKISHVVIKRMGASDEVTGMMRLVTTKGIHTTCVDAAAALSLAIHMGLPIFMDGEFSQGELQWEGHKHDGLDAESANTGHGELPRKVSTPIPQAFQDLIEGLGIPEGIEGPESPPGDGEFLST